MLIDEKGDDGTWWWSSCLHSVYNKPCRIHKLKNICFVTTMCFYYTYII